MACPSHLTPAPAPSWHQHTGRGVIWGRCLGKEAKDMTCFSLTYFFWKEPTGVAAVFVGRRSTGKGGQEQSGLGAGHKTSMTAFMTPSLLQNTCGVGVAQVQSYGTAMLLAYCLSVNLRKMALHKAGASMSSPLFLCAPYKNRSLLRKADMPACLSV